MSQRQAKRPYAGSQPSITSYFPLTSPTSQPLYMTSPQIPSDALPPVLLPADVQANLLSVGMRVRKSVPEGYKTGSYSAFTLFQDSPAMPVVPVQNFEVKRGGTRPRARELAPFCGILKVGGMAQQQLGVYETFDDEDADEEDDMAVLSQASTVSNASTASSSPGATNKRRFNLDDEGENVDEDEGKVVFSLGGRAIAVPRRLKKTMERAVRVVGQENVGDVDFEDAEFLDYGLAAGGDEEMGGV